MEEGRAVSPLGWGFLEEGLTREWDCSRESQTAALEAVARAGFSWQSYLFAPFSTLHFVYPPAPLCVGTCTAPWTSPIITHSDEGPPASPWSA